VLRIVALLLALVAMLPLRHPFPPITDFPEHAATIATVADVWSNGPLSTWYQLDFAHTQYWLMAVLGAALAPLVGGPAAALKVLLGLASVGLVAALLRLARALELEESLALVAVPLLWSRPFTLGFVPFLMATPLVLLVFAEVGAVTPPTPRRAVLASLLGLATFFLNLASVVWLVVGVVALAVTRERRLLPWRRLTPALALAVPVLAWLLFSDVTNVDASRFAVSMKGQWWSPKHLLLEAPEWLTDRWAGSLDGWCLAALLVAVALTLVPIGEKEASPGRWPMVALFVATASLTLALPFERGWLWGLSTRFLPITATLAPLAFSARRGVARRLAVGVFAGLALLTSWDAERNVVAAQAELEGLAVLEGLPSAARVLQLTFDDSSAVLRDATVSHGVAWHRVWNHGAAEPSFVDLPQSVVRYREGRAPWLRPWPWEFSPAEFDNVREGPHHEYVLVRGATSTFPPSGDGPRWRVLRELGSWRLFERER
jgi:hypothetical protein